MELTGKCKRDFKDWLTTYGWGIIRYPYKIFRELEPSMQYGVLVDFFGSVGIHVSMNYFYSDYWFDIQHIVKGKELKIEGSYMKSRAKTRTSAIRKSNELYNK